jgi:hypothetical protein
MAWHSLPVSGSNIHPANVAPASANAIMMPKGGRPAAKFPVPSMGSMIQFSPSPARSRIAGSAAQASSPMIPASGRMLARPDLAFLVRDGDKVIDGFLADLLGPQILIARHDHIPRDLAHQSDDRIMQFDRHQLR